MEFIGEFPLKIKINSICKDCLVKEDCKSEKENVVRCSNYIPNIERQKSLFKKEVE